MEARPAAGDERAKRHRLPATESGSWRRIVIFKELKSQVVTGLAGTRASGGPPGWLWRVSGPVHEHRGGYFLAHQAIVRGQTGEQALLSPFIVPDEGGDGPGAPIRAG
jgi:hypothetical protein